MSARERILARLTQNAPIGADAPTASPRATAPIAPDLVKQFLERATRLGSEVAEAATLADIPATVARYLDANQLPRHAVAWPELLPLPWQAANIDVQARAARADDMVGLTGAFAAIAETGTLMLLSGARTPATVSLLPETHIAVVATTSIVPTMEEAWARLRDKWDGIPRAVNFVSGPSRTADVEQTVTLGAHGPKRVLIVVVRTLATEKRDS